MAKKAKVPKPPKGWRHVKRCGPNDRLIWMDWTGEVDLTLRKPTKNDLIQEYPVAGDNDDTWYAVRKRKPAPSPLPALEKAVLRAAVKWEKGHNGDLNDFAGVCRELEFAVRAYRKAGGK